MKILLLRFSSIGDIVLTTPVARCIKLQLGAEVHFLTKSAFSGILRPNPHIDKVYSFEKDLDAELVGRLRAERYDLVVDLHNNLRSLRLKWALRRPSCAFDKLNWEKWLLVNLKINRLPNKHIVHRYLDTVSHLGVEYDGAGLDYFIPEETNLDEVPLPAVPFVAFVIGATHATKRMPEDKIVEICRLMRQPLVLLGGKAEADTGARVAKEVGEHVVNLCGVLTLHQSVKALQRSFKVISHDTGLMHIAAALRKPVVSVWGNTTPEFGMWPFYPTGYALNTSVQIAGLSCRPCSKIGFERCPRGHFKCMRDIAAASIVDALKQH